MSLVSTAAALIGAFAWLQAARNLFQPQRIHLVLMFGAAFVGLLLSFALFVRSVDGEEIVLFRHVSELSALLLSIVLLMLGRAYAKRSVDEAVLEEDIQNPVPALPEVLAKFPDPVAFLDTERKCRFVNSAFADYWNVPQDRCLGAATPQIIGNENFNRVRICVDRAFSRETNTFETVLSAPGKGERLVKVECVPVGQSPRVAGVLVFVREITDQRRAAELAQERQIMLDLSADVVGIGYLTWDDTLTLKSASESAVRIMDRTVEQARHDWSAATDFLSPTDRTRIEGALEDASWGNTPVQLEAQLHTRSGAQRIVRLSVARAPAGSSALLVAAIQDITDETRAIADLRTESARFRELTETGSDWVWETDADDRFTYISRGAQVVAGLDPDRFLGCRRFELPGIQNDPQLKQLSDAIEERQPFRSIRYGLTLTQGKREYFEISGKPAYDEAGVFMGYRGVGSVVTRFVEAERAGNAAKDILSTAIETVSAVFAMFDAEDRLVLCNRRYTEINPVSQQDVVERISYETIIDRMASNRIVRGDKKAVEAWAKTRLARRENKSGPVVYELDSGIWVEVTDYFLADGTVLTIGTEIGDRIAAENALRTQEMALQQLHRRDTLGQMVAAIAHEINQPLTAISNYAGGCLRWAEQGDFSSERMMTAYQRMQEQSDRASAILRTIRDHFTLSDPTRISVALSEILTTVELLTLPEAKTNGVNLAVYDETNNASLMCAKVEIEQLVINLIKNAIEAASQHGIDDASVTVNASVAQGNAIITITDTGSGIPEDMLGDLFEPFKSSKADGLGIGLAICRTIAEEHNGEITHDRTMNGHTRFTVDLPLTIEGQSDAS